jgi:hypothetical protein
MLTDKASMLLIGCGTVAAALKHWQVHAVTTQLHHESFVPSVTNSATEL